MKQKSRSVRESVEPHKGDNRYVRRDKKGESNNVVDVEKSLSADKRQVAKNTVPKGHGDWGDTKR